MKDWSNAELNKKLASEHTDEMDELYLAETFRCVRNARIFDSSVFGNQTVWSDIQVRAKTPQIICDKINTVDALYKYGEGKTCVLDFASFTTPGGNFSEGAMGQEEMLCHCSNLYNILLLCSDFFEANQNDTCRGLYADRALFLQDVCFCRDEVLKPANVIVCSAPNKAAYFKFCLTQDIEDKEMLDDFHQALSSRVSFLRHVVDIANGGELDTLILGAWGCGLGGNDPFEVARLLEANFFRTTASRIVYAVPEMNRKNSDVFQRIFGGDDQ